MVRFAAFLPASFCLPLLSISLCCLIHCPIRAQGRESVSAHPGSSRLTLLDEVGRLIRPISAAEVRVWRKEITKKRISSRRAVLLHIRLGEYELAQNQEPKRAIRHFQRAQRLTRRSDTRFGLAAYDTATAHFYEGAYQKAAEAFQSLLVAKTALHGYDRRNCALWFKHASACAGYHAERAKLGITEPPRIDPLCAAAGLAVCLRGIDERYDKKTVLTACRHTGEGSSLQDILAACKKLNLAGRAITADEKGLMALPKSLIAFVEHDHFVALTRADKRGVSYLCSDCGAWPGGRRDLDWQQWRAMGATGYVSVARKGSKTDRIFSALFARPASDAPSVRFAALGQVPASTAQMLAQVALLKGHVMLWLPPLPVVCGSKPSSQHCHRCYTPCPEDSAGGGSGLAGPTRGDPVNLATGEEEYSPSSDLTVYNPIGPSVTWARVYNSLRGPDGTYPSDDFGIGWSHPYNVGVYDANGSIHAALISQGASGMVNKTGTDSPGSGLTWNIYKDGSSIATSSSPNNWNVTSAGYSGCSVTVPSSATVSDGYSVRYFYNSQPCSGIFAVTAPGSINQGASATISGTGNHAPASGLTWDIVLGSSTVASSAATNGWSVTGSNGNFLITVPFTAAIASSYEIRYSFSQFFNMSAYFNVTGNLYEPNTGTKYLVFPNGAQFSFTANAIPTPSNPAVPCGVQAGAPMLVEWDYDGSLSGHYTITFANRTKWVTTTLSKVINGAALYYSLYQIVDRVGNPITFYYGMVGPAGFPLISAIKNSAGYTLLSFARSSSTGNLTSVSDGYNRSVYYHVGTYATTNVSPGYAQSYQEVDSVSQIVTTGTANPPNRYSYGYTNVNNGEGNEQVPFLASITVPSPTGAGNATATINYRSDTPFVSSVVDANGNTRSYTAVDQNHTKVTVTNSLGTVAYSYTVGFDANMSLTSATDGSNTTNVASRVYADPNDPLRPSAVTDGNGKTAYFTWDRYGNCLTVTSPRGTTTTFSYDYSPFALGRMIRAQESGKAPSTIAYYEPGGLTQSVTTPLPGTSNGTSTTTTSYTYDSLGNVLTQTSPGNNAATSMTTTYNYTTDGAYSQAQAIGQPITATNNLGKVTHYRYDARGNRTVLVDALGNEVDFNYNIANQPLQTIFPATGQTGTGHTYTYDTYLYAGGPLCANIN